MVIVAARARRAILDLLATIACTVSREAKEGVATEKTMTRKIAMISSP